MQVRLTLAATLVACSTTHNPVTAPGTMVLDWDSSKAARAPVKTAVIGARTSKDYVIEVARNGAPPLSYDLHLELAPIDFDEDGQRAHHTTAVVVKLKVKDNAAWEVSGKCDEGPDYQFGPVDAQGHMTAPPAMVQPCYIHEHHIGGRVFKDSWDVGTSLEIFGDGKVEASPREEVSVRPG